MRSLIRGLLLGLLALSIPGRGAAVELEQVVSHEHPFFKPQEARLTVGRDGRVYLAMDGKSGRLFGFVLRMGRTGEDRFGAEVFPGQGGSAGNATANKDGVMATASPGAGGHKVALYGPGFRLLGGVDDFDRDTYSPAHVEAGARGGFFRLGTHPVTNVPPGPPRPDGRGHPPPGRPPTDT